MKSQELSEFFSLIGQAKRKKNFDNILGLKCRLDSMALTFTALKMQK